MDCTPGKMCQHALVAVDDALYGIIICEHCEDGIAFTGLGEVFSCFGAQCDQRLRPFLRSVINCDGVTGLDEVGCHPAAHMSEANEANVHVSLLLLPSIRVGNAASPPNNTPLFLHAPSRSLALRVIPREFCRFALPIPLSPKPTLATPGPHRPCTSPRTRRSAARSL